MDKALETQLANIEKRSGKSMADLKAIVRNSGLQKHGELRDMLKRDLGMGHGDANVVVHLALQPDASPDDTAAADISTVEVVDALYAGPKAALRPIHDAVMTAIEGFGPFDVAPKKTYLSLRRKKQFATVGPATNTRVEVGLNMKGVAATGRLLEEPPGRMCQYKVKLTSVDEVDGSLVRWMRQAYDQAGPADR